MTIDLRELQKKLGLYANFERAHTRTIDNLSHLIFSPVEWFNGLVVA